MQDPWSLTTMVLVAVLVGACLPVLLQLFLALGATRRLLGELHETSRRLNRATTGFEDSAQHARSLLDAAGDLGRSVQQINRSLRMAVALGSAIGPAIAIAIKTLVERRAAGDGGAEAESGDGGAAERDPAPAPGATTERQGGEA